MSPHSKGKILALDIGTRRTGVSISDENHEIAFIRPEITHSNKTELINSVCSLAEEEGIELLVLGMPLDMQGEETDQTAFTREIQNELSLKGLEIVTMDERLTSIEASSRTNSPKRAVDSEAAQILLETYLASNTEIPGSSLP